MSTRAKDYRASAIWMGAGIHRTGEADRRYYLGAIPTRHGYVSLYAEDKYAHWQFIWDGRQYDLTIRRTITDRGIVTIGRRFADDVVNGEVPA